MTDAGAEPDEKSQEESEEEPREAPASLPVLLEAVLGVGSELELNTTLQHIVDSATELCAARYGALGVIDPERVRLTALFTAGITEAERAAIPRLRRGRRSATPGSSRPRAAGNAGSRAPPP